MSSDGRIVIDTDLNSKGLEKGLDEIQKKFESLGKNNSLNTLGDIFDTLTNKSTLFGKTFNIASSLVSSSAALASASVVALVAGFAKLYEASKQNFVDNLQKIGSALEPAINAVKSLGREIATVFTNVTGFEFSFSSLITEAIEFESTMAKVAAVMGVTGDGISQLTMVARDFGASTRYSATEVAEAFTYMGMAGWSANEAIEGMSSVLNLATIGAVDLGLASDIVTDGLTALGMTASQAGNFVDMLVATITSSNTNVEMFGETMKYAGTIAGTLGVSMADLSVAIGLMADSGIKASNAGTAMRTILTNLTAPTDSAAKAMKQYGIEAIYASDGSLDLESTLIGLRSSLKSLPLKEQAEAAKALAGKTGLGGLLAIVNATDERFQELTESINNSTATVSYFNENCANTGKTGQEATDAINMMKDAFEGAETTAAGLNLTTKDLALAVQVLGSDADVTSDNVENLLNVLGAMKTPTEQQIELMKELGITYRELDDESFDYSNTCAMVDSSIIGLTKSQKEQIKAQLDHEMSIESANKVLSKYNMTAKTSSTGQIDMIANLKELRNAFNGMDEATLSSTLSQLGLNGAFSEINEILNMSDEEFKLYCDNLETTKGLSEDLGNAMNDTTEGGLKALSSALSDIGIAAFDLFKESVDTASGVLANFFSTWRDADSKGAPRYTFDTFKIACDDLLETVKDTDLAGAIGHAIDNMVNFISNGGLSRVLAIGGEIVNKICDGIIQNKSNIEVGISSAINQIATWISTHAGEIGEAGNTILNAISKGITDNKDSIRSALEAVTAVMDNWVVSSASIQSLCSNFADIFIESFASQMFQKSTIKMGEIGNGIITSLYQSITGALMKTGEFGLNAWDSIMSWLFPEAHAGEVTEEGKLIGSKIAEGTVIGVDENGKYIYDSTSNVGKQAGQGVVDGAEQGIAPLSTVMQLQEATLALQQSATNMYNGAKVSFTKLADVGKQSMTDMYLGMQGSLTAAENSVKTSATNMYLGASQSFNSLRDAATTSMISLKNVVTTQSNEARNAAMTAFVSLGNVINTQVSEARNAVTSQFISIKNVISTQTSEARNAATTQFISIKNVAQTQASETRNAITTQFISIKNVISTQISEARNAFTSQMLSMAAVARTQASAITSTFKGCASQMYSIGVQIGRGLNNGLASQKSSIIATANGIANSVVASMKRALDIHSPSRVTREIGVYAVEGLEVGMESKKVSLDRSVDSSMIDMYNRMKGAVDSSMMSTRRSISNNSTVITDSSRIPEEYNKRLDNLANALSNIKVESVVQLDKQELGRSLAPVMSEELTWLIRRGRM